MSKTAFISDIHGNAVALRAVLADVQAQGCSRVFMLGDVINGMEPVACLQILSEIRHLTCIKGNAEHYVLTPDLESFPLKNRPLFPGLLRLVIWWRDQLSSADLTTIRAWPDTIQLQDLYIAHDSPLDRKAILKTNLKGLDEKYRDLLFHGEGIPKDIARKKLLAVLDFMEKNRVARLFVGHTHAPYIRRVDRKMICNPGSVGFNLDGDPRPSWILQEDSTGELHIRRVAYDIDEAIDRLKAVGFRASEDLREQQAYIKMLRTGVHWRAHL